jgi:hypothetical protein
MSVGRGGVIGPPAWVTATRWAAGEGWSVTQGQPAVEFAEVQQSAHGPVAGQHHEA